MNLRRAFPAMASREPGHPSRASPNADENFMTSFLRSSYVIM